MRRNAAVKLSSVFTGLLVLAFLVTSLGLPSQSVFANNVQDDEIIQETTIAPATETPTETELPTIASPTSTEAPTETETPAVEPTTAEPTFTPTTTELPTETLTVEPTVTEQPTTVNGWTIDSSGDAGVEVYKYDQAQKVSKTIQNPLAMLAQTNSATATASFSITFQNSGTSDPWGAACDATPSTAQAAIQAAAALWSNVIVSSVPITITVCWSNMGTDTTTLGYSASRERFHNSSYWYEKALADALSGSNLDSTMPDINITYNSAYPWYYGTDGNTTSGMIDLVSVALHEIAHGLGLSGWANYSSGTGSQAYQGYPEIYDSYLEDSSGTKLTAYTNPSTALGSLLTSNSLWFNGTNAKAANGGTRVKIYAPPTWDGGSSIYHVDFSTFYGTSESLMVYAIGPGSSQHNIGPVLKGMLKDLGWTINSSSTIVLPTPQSPTGTVATSSPIFTWTTVSGATQYQLKRTIGTSSSVLTVNATQCGTLSTCTASFGSSDDGNYQWQVQAYVDGIWSGYSNALSYTISAASLARPTPLTPSGTITSTSPTFTWTPVSGATVYSINLIPGTTSTGWNVGSSFCGTSSCSFTPTTTLAAGTYQWQIMAYVSGWSDYSSLVSFTISSPTTTVPTPQSPTGTITSTTPTYTWSVVSGATQYRYTLLSGTTTQYTKTVDAITCGTSTCTTTPTDVLSAGSYQWQVQAYANSTWGAYSSLLSFTISPATVGVPTLVSPSGTITTTTPTYSWTPVSGATQYELDLVTNSNTISGTVSNSVCGTSTCSYTPNWILSNGSSNQWQVRAYVNGTWGALSSALSFTVSTSSVGVPTPQSPSGTITSTDPTYNWTAVTGATQYRINLTYGTTSLTDIISSSNCTTTCSAVTDRILTSGMSYQWQVQAYVNNAWGSYSSTLSFLVNSSAIAIPTPVDPSGTISTTDPDFHWKSVTDATQYRIKVTNSNNISTTSVAVNACVFTECYSEAGNFPSGSYTWQVMAYVSGSWGSYSTPVSFFVNVNYINIPTLRSPTGTVTTVYPSFTWSHNSNATAYHIKVIEGTDVVTEETVGGLSDCDAGGCLYYLNEALEQGKTYQWQVQSNYIDSEGNESWGDYSGLATFSIASAIPTPQSPTGTITSTTPTYIWTVVSGATQYRYTLLNGTTTQYTKTVDAATCGTSTCTTTPTDVLSAGSYQWQVQAYANSTWGAYSSLLSFTVSTTTVGVPTPQSPTGAITSSMPQYIWTIVSGATQYHIKVTKGTTTFTATIASSNCGASTCSSTLVPPFSDGSYQWQVQAYVNSVWGDYSSALSYTISSSSTGVSTAQTPSGTITSTTPAFVWTTVSGATQYGLFVFSSDGSLVKYATPSSSSCGTTLCNVSFSDALPLGSYYWNVLAYMNGSWGHTSSNVSFAISTNTVGVPTPQSPTGTITSTTPTYIWSVVSGATQYRYTLLNGTTTQYTKTVDAATCGTSTCTTTPTDVLSAGSYQWQVQAYANSTWGAYSSLLSFTVSPATVGVPTLTSPSGTVTTTTPTYLWTPVSGATQYELDLVSGTNTYSGTVSNSVCGTSTCSYTPNWILYNGSSNQWQVRAYVNGTWGALSSALSFTVSTSSVSAPTPGAPNGTIVDPNPFFHWTVVTGATQYRVIVLKDTATYANNVYSSSICDSTQCMTMLNVVMTPGNYQWQVQAYANGTWGSLSDFESFTENSVTIPTLQTPKGTISTSKPTFIWTPATMASSYRLSLMSGSTAVYTTDYDNDSICDDSICSVTPTTTLSSGNYQWSVKANFYGAWGSYAPYLSFTVGTSPIPSSPSGSISDNTPTFKWSKVGSATQYSYTLLKGTTTVYTKTVTSSACTTSGCSNTPTTVLSDGSYTWKVRAYVSGTWKNYSSSLAFKLATIPILSAPSGTVKTATPTFTWTLISNATSYSYTVYKGTATLYSRTVASSACGSSTTYCADTPSTILNSGAYTWKVRAYAGGVWNAYSAVKSFTVSTTAFNSQFTSENTGWSAVSGTWSRSSGYYQAAGVANSIISSKHNNTYGTMTYEVKMKRTGCATCGNVLFFNGATSGKNWSKAYAFIYVNDGEFSIVSISGTTVTKLIDWTAYSGISTSWNILKVTYNKSTGYTEFFINGVSVATGTLTVFTSGQVGAGLYSDSGSSNKLSIDYATLNLIAPSAVVTENNNGIVIHEQTAPVQNGSTSYLKMP